MGSVPSRLDRHALRGRRDGTDEVLGRSDPDAGVFEALGVPEVAPIAKVMVRQMLFLDAPAHTRLRKLAGGARSSPRR